MLTIDSISQVIQSKFSAFIRKGVSISPHFVPLNLKVLERSIGSITKKNAQFNASKFRNTLYVHIQNKFSNTIILGQSSFSINGNKNISLADLMTKFTPALVFINNNSKENLVGVLFNSYQTAGATLLTSEISKFINDQLKNILADNTEIDLAYILRNPEGQKLREFLGIFNSISGNTVNSPGVNIPNNKSGVLQSQIIVESLLKDYAIYEERALGTYSISIDKEVSNFVTSIKANILILHDSKVKAEVENAVKSKGFLTTIAKLLPSIKIAKSSFIQDIKDKIRGAFLGKPAKASKGTQKTSSKISGTKSPIKLNTTKGISSEFIIPPAFRSLTNLQNLINVNFAESVKDNMGTGNSKDILNYRTGRLANSFKVTAVSQDRQGALTAFFTYMKYPYATFSQGGVQQYPRSRDPIVLGERAIRDIATNILKERLRAIGI